MISSSRGVGPLNIFGKKDDDGAVATVEKEDVIDEVNREDGAVEIPPECVEEELTETQKLLQKVKQAGTAGGECLYCK